MLFSNKIQKQCSHCIHSSPIDEQYIICGKKGVRECTDKCLHFTYDPCKRIPSKPKATDFSKYEEYDYSL